MKLADGTEVRVQLCGDEHAHFWRAGDGSSYTFNAEKQTLVPVSHAQLAQRSARRSSSASKARRARRQSIRRTGDFTGTKRGIVILAQFSDKKFADGHDSSRYNDILNTEGYSEGNFQGSVRDYFKAQSGGIFDLQFDVVGPVTLPQKYSYYGANDSEGYDKYPGQMIVEACNIANADVDFSLYDWSGDGYVDQVYVVYAGKGEADSGEENTVWPHEWTLSESDYGATLSLDGVTIDTYACGSELDAYRQLQGIGTFCHEFSHCLGFPDTYDTEYAGYFGMGDLDLMCAGSYNGDGFLPAGYTAYEKWMAGWITPIELSDEDVTVTNLAPMSEGGGAYVIYNKAHPDEYYLIENRQPTRWDADIPDAGLQITHVDYDETAWLWNIVNTVVDYTGYYGYDNVKNDHERMTIFHADNDDDKSYWNSWSYSYSKTTIDTDLYPVGSRDSLTNTSKPACKLYNKNTDGSKMMNCGILDIRQNADGTMAFRYRASAGTGETPAGDALFYESFDLCDGKGGNDGSWNGSIANATFTPDNDGWVTTKASGASECAKFGTSGTAGSATTPGIEVDGQAVLSFMAAAWDSSRDKTTLTLTATGGTLDTDEFAIERGDWTECTATITASGTVTLTFDTGSRFFLDEVKVTAVSADGVELLLSSPSLRVSNVFYDLSGRSRGTNAGALRRGIYVKNGKKIIIK